MPNLKEIKSRINNVTITQKVTFSMKNIAAAKLSQARKLFNDSKMYFEYNSKILHYLLYIYKNQGENSIKNPLNALFYDDLSLPKLVVIIGADKGLCGGFNNNIIKHSETLLKELKDNNHDFHILTLGNKIKSYFNNHYKDKVSNQNYKLDISSFSIEDCLKIINFIFNLLLNKKIGSCTIVYTEFISVLEGKPKSLKVLPVDFLSLKQDASKDNMSIDELNIVTDSFINTVINSICKDVLLSNIYKAIISSLTSEYASRVSAMDSASNNSDDLLKKLSLEYNRTRQSLITKELIEIISGNEAL